MDTNRLILEAIALRKCLSVSYNRTQFTLAPHILYTRHGEPHIDAVTLEKNGLPPREFKMATFRLSGLTVHGVLDKDFMPDRDLFESDLERYQGTTLFAVQN